MSDPVMILLPWKNITEADFTITTQYGVCVGGRWDGWLFRKHPDGQWVSVEKLKIEGRPFYNTWKENQS